MYEQSYASVMRAGDKAQSQMYLTRMINSKQAAIRNTYVDMVFAENEVHFKRFTQTHIVSTGGQTVVRWRISCARL
jgi:hypothetical protein